MPPQSDCLGVVETTPPFGHLRVFGHPLWVMGWHITPIRPLRLTALNSNVNSIHPASREQLLITFQKAIVALKIREVVTVKSIRHGQVQIG
jgi:hypothetical protein